MRRRAAAALLAAAATASTAGLRAQPVETILRDLAGERGSEAAVEVEGRLERDGATGELVVTLTPRGGARLVGDPGIQLVPLPGPEGRWAEPATVELVDPGRPYLEGPVELRVPILPGAAGEASAEVAYAWCVVERICLFGQATVRVPLASTDG